MSKINSFLAASKPYTGNIYIRIKEMTDVFGLPICSATTFYKIQKIYTASSYTYSASEI